MTKGLETFRTGLAVVFPIIMLLLIGFNIYLGIVDVAGVFHDYYYSVPASGVLEWWFWLAPITLGALFLAVGYQPVKSARGVSLWGALVLSLFALLTIVRAVYLVVDLGRIAGKWDRMYVENLGETNYKVYLLVTALIAVFVCVICAWGSWVLFAAASRNRQTGIELDRQDAPMISTGMPMLFQPAGLQSPVGVQQFSAQQSSSTQDQGYVRYNQGLIVPRAAGRQPVWVPAQEVADGWGSGQVAHYVQPSENVQLTENVGSAQKDQFWRETPQTQLSDNAKLETEYRRFAALNESAAQTGFGTEKVVTTDSAKTETGTWRQETTPWAVEAQERINRTRKEVQEEVEATVVRPSPKQSERFRKPKEN